MQVQNQVAHTLRANLGRLREVLDRAATDGIERIGRIADQVCEAFDLRDSRGRLQRASCRKALATLAAAGQVTLPPPRRRGGGSGRQPRVLAQAVAAAHAVPPEVGGIEDLKLVLVESDAQRLVWNTLLAHEHPRGASLWVGPQLRYLIGSAHGWLGGIGFAAAARRLKARDRWIGWDDAGRGEQLHRVLGLSRLLIRPGVVCRNLASILIHVLGRVVRVVAADFERCFGYRPWLLETFVDRGRAHGRKLAGGELGAGGRERRARSSGPPACGCQDAQGGVSVCPGAAVAGTPGGAGSGGGVAGRLARGSTPRTWAGHEFGGAALGDARLSARLVESAQLLGAGSVARHHRRHARSTGIGEGPLPTDRPACGQRGDGGEHPAAASRAHAAPDGGAPDGAVYSGWQPAELHAARADRGAGRDRQQPDWRRGARLASAHDTGGQPPRECRWGSCERSSRPPTSPATEEAPGAPQRLARKAREQRKSYRWIEGLHDCAQAVAALPDTRVVCTMDREADFVELFVERREHVPQVELLVRAKVDRVLSKQRTAAGDHVTRRLFDEGARWSCPQSLQGGSEGGKARA